MKGGDDIDGDVLGGAAAGHWSISLVPVCGTEDIARRGVRHIRFLSRVLQSRAGHREHHGQPVPAALAKQHRNKNYRKQE